MRHRYIFVGAYHKTGTAWMLQVMRAAAQSLGIKFHNNVFRNQLNLATVESGICFDDHSIFPHWLQYLDFAGFRMIRDPRDVVVSGAQYHMRSSEAWLHKPWAKLGGRTYHQAIQALSDEQERYRFEMEYVGGDTIGAMATPEGVTALLKTVRYEDLMLDHDFSRFRLLMNYVGLREEACELAITAFRKHSLIGDATSTAGHGSSQGELGRWRNSFTRATAETFAELHQEKLVKLGYEENDDWVAELSD